MNAQGMLEQLLKSVLSMIEGKPQVPGTPAAGGGSAGLGKFGAGVATGGALGLLLGSKRGRRFGGKALKLGSVAALGALAYKGLRELAGPAAAAAAWPAAGCDTAPRRSCRAP